MLVGAIGEIENVSQVFHPERPVGCVEPMPSIVESEIVLVGMFSQNGLQTLEEGAAVDIVFDNVPGRIYH